MAQPASIQVLSDEVINRIAAGEVVERPASVVKELMENAIDAGASAVDVDIVAGGKKLIRVTDDGAGMDRDNALLAVQRHATSKIRSDRDIESVHTLGFRGEALAAIAGVSRFELTTRRRDAPEAVRVRISGGRMDETAAVGAPPGTSVAVRNLFFNVPARRKFLRMEATELANVRQVFLLYVMAHTDISFRLTVDEREAYSFPGGSSFEDRLHAMYGDEFMEHLRPLEYQSGDIRIAGRVGLPLTHRTDRGDQYIFVNRRPASAPVIGYALNEAYRGRLPKGRHPVVLLFVSLPPGALDVNVHPTKREVRFRQPGAVRDALMAAIGKALDAPAERPSAPAPERLTPIQSGRAPFSRSAPPVFQRQEMLAMGDAAETVSPAPSAEAGATPWSSVRIIDDLQGRVLVLKTDAGIVFMDVAASYERVLFERLQRAMKNRRIPSQGLLEPETVDLPPREAAVLRRQTRELRDLGFGISEFGGDTFVLDAVPSGFGELPARRFLRDLAAELLEGVPARGREARERLLLQSACHVAGQYRVRWTPDEQRELVDALAAAEMPYTSPRGRPTLFLVSYAEIGRKLGRKALF